MRNITVVLIMLFVGAAFGQTVVNSFTVTKSSDYREVTFDVSFDESDWAIRLGQTIATTITLGLRNSLSTVDGYSEVHNGSFSTNINKLVIPGTWYLHALVETTWEKDGGTSPPSMVTVDRTDNPNPVAIEAFGPYNSVLDPDAQFIVYAIENAPIDVINTYLIGKGWTDSGTQARSKTDAFMQLTTYWLSNNVAGNPLIGHGYTIPLVDENFARLLMSVGVGVGNGSRGGKSAEETWLRTVTELLRSPTLRTSNYPFTRTPNEARAVMFGAFYTAERVIEFRKAKAEDSLAEVDAIIAGQPTLDPNDFYLFDENVFLE